MLVVFVFVVSSVNCLCENDSQRHTIDKQFFLRDLCVRWSFGRCCVRERYIRLFFMWADTPLAHYQIVDLEDIDYADC